MKKTKLKKTLTFLILALVFIATIKLALSLDTLTVKEGDLIQLKTKAVDPDGDNVSYTYTKPLDENGTWQTGYEDAGNYETTVIASDGKSTSQKEFIIEIINVNRLPTIQIQEPIKAQETETIKLKPELNDPDGDQVKIIFEEPFNEQGEWQTSYEDAGVHQIKLTAQDEQNSTTKTITIEIQEKNRPPKIENTKPEKQTITQEGETTQFLAKTTDPDGDDIKVSWKIDGITIPPPKSDKLNYYANYESAGQHKITIIVTDQNNLSINHTWEITTQNTNRKPKLNITKTITVNEGQKIVLNLPKTDQDGDKLSYQIDKLFENGTWQTSYEDAGTHKIKIEANDGELTSQETITLQVKDVDRPPQFINLAQENLTETQKLSKTILAEDPDGDEVTITAQELPSGASFEEDTLTWKPGQDYIKKPQNFIARLVSKLRIDKYIFSETKQTTVKLQAWHPVEVVFLM